MTGTFKYMKGQYTYMQSPEEVISKASNEKDAIQNNIREVADWFHDKEGGLIEKSKAVERINDELDIVDPHVDIASDIVSSLAGDHVDPVQHVSNSDGQFVGVIEYDEHDGYYSFTEYHDISGEHTRAVCGTCIESSTRSSEPFTRHTGEFGNEPHGNVDELHTILSDHIEEEHDSTSEVKTGATLASGTTISGNASLHAGNLNTSYTFTAEQTFSGGIDLSGGNIASVGGTTDASSGAIRLANNTEIRARNDADSGDIIALQTTAGDDVRIGDGSTSDIIVGSSLRLIGNIIRGVGGTTDANSGAIRLANATSINARNSGNSDDFGISFTSNDTISMDNANVEIPNGGLTLSGTLSSSSISTDGLSGSVTGNNTINSLAGSGLEVNSNTLETAETPGAIREVVNDDSGVLDDVEILEFGDRFTVSTTIIDDATVNLNTPYTDLSTLFASPVAVGDTLEVGNITDGNRTVYDASTDTVGDGTTTADHALVSTSQVDNTDYNEAVQNLSGSGTIDIDLSQGNSVEISATGDVTITFSNVSSTPSGNSLLVYFEDGDGSGPHAISWPSSVVWNNGNNISEVPASSDIEASLITGDGGTEWRGRKSGESFA